MGSTYKAVALAGATLLALAMEPARAQDAPNPQFRFAYPERMPGLVRPVLPASDPAEWTKGSSFAPGTVPAIRDGTLRLRLAVSADDRITDCAAIEPGADVKLAALACKLAQTHGGFRHALGWDGKPAAGSAELVLHYTPPLVIPTAPGVRMYAPDWVLRTPPQWAAFAPPGNPSGDVGAVMSFGTVNDDPTGFRTCSVRRSSGDAALDAATCAALKSAAYAKHPTNVRNFNSVAIMVHWRDGAVRWEALEEDKSWRLKILNSAALDVFAPPPNFYDAGGASAIFRPDGSIDCQVWRSSGSDATDLAFCTAVRDRLRFEGARDVFGLPIPGRESFSFGSPPQP